MKFSSLKAFVVAVVAMTFLSGTLVADVKCGSEKKAEAKCASAKCGADKKSDIKKPEAKCASAKCGGDKK